MARFPRRILTIVFAILALSCTVFAEGDDPYSDYAYLTPYYAASLNQVNDGNIINFRFKLYEMGFYVSSLDGNSVNSKDLTEQDIAALHAVRELNKDIDFNPEIGVHTVVYYCVMEPEVYGVLITPNNYSDIAPGTTDSDAVGRAQERLKQLGYDSAAGFEYTFRDYDDAMQSAIVAFVRCNGNSYTPSEGLTVQLQQLLFSDAANSYSEKAFAPVGLRDKVFTYLGAKKEIAGAGIPNWALLLAGFALIIVIVILALKIFAPSDSKRSQGKTFRTEGGIHFDIAYRDDKYSYNSAKNQVVRIGRATGAFPLNLSDGSISRKHCEITWEQEKVMLTDFSSNGTTVNGRVYNHGQCRLHSGDTIEVGKHRIKVQF